MHRSRCAQFGAALILVSLVILSSAVESAAASRQGDRFGIRVGAWPQSDVAGTLARISLLGGDTLVYDAVVEEKGHMLPFLELYGLFNLHSMWWVELSAGFSQRRDVEVTGYRLNPPPADTAPQILLGQGRVDFIPLFLGIRAVKELGGVSHPHNLYARGGATVLIAADQPSLVSPDVRGVYTEGTKAAFGFLIGGGGEYYLTDKFGLVGDVAYRLSDLNYTDQGEFDLSGVWISAGVTLRVR